MVTKKFNLSEKVIGCKNCLGEWIEAKYVRKLIEEIKKELREHTKMHYHSKQTCIQVIRKKLDELSGDKLI